MGYKIMMTDIPFYFFYPLKSERVQKTLDNQTLKIQSVHIIK